MPLTPEILELQQSFEALRSAINTRTSMCARHEDLLKKQEELNLRRDEQLANLQNSGFGIQQIVLELSKQFKEDRKQVQSAINTIATAMERSERLQDERHERTVEIQQQNLETNMSMLKIFQDHQERAEKNFDELEGKIVINKASHKALIGLGGALFILLAGFVTSMLLPPIDTAWHAAAATFVKLLPWHW